MHNNQTNQHQDTITEQYSHEFYIEMKIWGILSELMQWKEYTKYCGTVNLYKPISKVLTNNQRNEFQKRVSNKFGINFTLEDTDKIIHIVRQVINS